ncbi:hypothetical protein [Metabacillus niabensis]|uniref:hypothetical protein n=1 Tax=Metabacillus niabensis TaxID=324854 RepID=UPI00399FE34D
MKIEVNSQSSAMPEPLYYNISYIFHLQEWLNNTYDSKLVLDGILGIKTREAILGALQKELLNQAID